MRTSLFHRLERLFLMGVALSATAALAAPAGATAPSNAPPSVTRPVKTASPVAPPVAAPPALAPPNSPANAVPHRLPAAASNTVPVIRETWKHIPPSPTVVSFSSTPPPSANWDFLAEHLQLGVGYVSYSLRDNKGNGRFLGSIDELEKDGNGFATVLVGWSFNRFLGIEGRYEKYQGRTYTDTSNDHSDGVVVLKGPVAYLQGRLPLDVPAGWLSGPYSDVPAWTRRLTPFAGLGYTLMSVSMDTEPWWALGYSSPESYRSLGSPTVYNHGYYRSFDLSDAHAVVYLLGASARVSDHLSLNLLWTRADLDIDASFYLGTRLGGTGTIPFHYSSLGMDLRYVF